MASMIVVVVVVVVVVVGVTNQHFSACNYSKLLSKCSTCQK